MTDLYKALGVKKNASKASIRKAYKKAAMKTHPDTGGSPEKFALVKRAHDILTDDERRQKYDSTGDDSETQPDNAFSQVMNIIAFAFNMVLGECQQQGQSPLERDMIESMRRKINGNISESEKNIRIQKNMLETDMKLRSRFSRKKKSEPNIFDSIIGHRIKQLNEQIAANELGIKNGKEALEFLKDFNFKSDEPEYQTRSGWTLSTGITF